VKEIGEMDFGAELGMPLFFSFATNWMLMSFAFEWEGRICRQC